MRPRRLALWLGSAACLASAGCAHAPPDPRATAAAWSQAVARGDTASMASMLDARSRRGLSSADLARIAADDREAADARAALLRRGAARASTSARVAWPDGERATLELEGDAFRVATADALPARGRTPDEALASLGQALAHPSYARLLRVLSPATARALDAEVRALAEGLAHPESLDVRVTGATATTTLPGGHVVKLRREAGLWRVEDVD